MCYSTIIYICNTVLSLASVHEHLQLKHQNWGWAVTRRRCLKGSTISVQVPTQDAKLAARGYRINLHHRFAQQWKTLHHARRNRLVASLPRFCSIRRLQYVNFVPQTNNATNKATDICVWNFDARCHGTWSASERSLLCTWTQRTYFWLTMQQFSMVEEYMKDLRKPLYWGLGTCLRVHACPGQYGTESWWGTAHLIIIINMSFLRTHLDMHGTFFSLRTQPSIRQVWSVWTSTLNLTS